MMQSSQAATLAAMSPKEDTAPAAVGPAATTGEVAADAPAQAAVDPAAATGEMAAADKQQMHQPMHQQIMIHRLRQ